ncbi:M23 family metallopeptidase [Roseofilum casamattae]|uniref:M23 family metallopeptidase n=1 Tax=Roseofilum casamattae BLCC-M143 TaxID=3022442 RepID=A0ABT7C213_9CYAN|nr:M23 family metallopeptidase [Roseofilum casamattae]MDJ1185469.1 M23 family metallopeptidase [Roseofilum casamattae BLCC-M143]
MHYSSGLVPSILGLFLLSPMTAAAIAQTLPTLEPLPPLPEQPIPVRPNPDQWCPKEAALDRLTYHTIAPGETLNSIARTHKLLPATLMGLNRALRSGRAPVGTEIVIPPYDGILVRIPPGKTWRDVGESYQIPLDALFEVNGCQQNLELVFVPGVNWSPGRPSAQTRSQLSSYPLPAIAPILKPYGWSLNAQTSRREFSNGVDLRAEMGTEVFAVGNGIVAYAGDRGSYGQLVVINHAGGRQTRYAHLDTIGVSPGQQIQQGQRIGTVGTTGTPRFSVPYLHFEVRYKSDGGWVAEDPGLYMQTLGQTRRY